MKHLEVAMPQLIPQDNLNMEYVNKWKLQAEKSLRQGKVETHKFWPNTDDILYHYRKSSVSGVWFFSEDGKNIDFLYAYQSLRLGGKHIAAEALAYSFNPDVRGVIGDVFFDYLLPDQKFVITDYIYTPDGHKWFKAEYTKAFGMGYRVYSIDLTSKLKMTLIDRETFRSIQDKYWGQDTAHQKYRFAIELP